MQLEWRITTRPVRKRLDIRWLLGWRWEWSLEAKQKNYLADKWQQPNCYIRMRPSTRTTGRARSKPAADARARQAIARLNRLHGRQIERDRRYLEQVERRVVS